MAQIINNTPFTGHVNSTAEQVIQLVQSRFARGFWGTLGDWLKNNNVRTFKFGITYDPEGRARKYGQQYQFMDVLYQTSVYSNSQDMERILISTFQNHPGCENIRHGGAGNISPSGPYFTYVVYTIGPAR